MSSLIPSLRADAVQKIVHRCRMDSVNEDLIDLHREDSVIEWDSMGLMKVHQHCEADDVRKWWFSVEQRTVSEFL
jgi:hypothetical protein